MHFRILKMIATNGFLTAPECNKFVFGRSCAYRAPQTSSWFKALKGPYF